MSLVALCVQSLIPFVDQIHLPCRLQRLGSVLELIPDPANVDPRLWAVLIQIYDNLPPFFASQSISLADTRLPLLQSIPSTQSFSLITILECPQIADSTIIELRFIHTLTAFDAAQSTLSSYAIKTLASFTGSWQLRILSLRNCKHITNDAFPHFTKFPLLSVLDLRGTRCNTYNSSLPFHPSSHEILYHPTSLKSALTTLHSLHSNLYSSANPYFLHINALRHRPTRRPKIPTVTPQDAFFVIPSDNSKIQVGSSHLLEERERGLVHQHAWYQRSFSIDPDLTRCHPKQIRSPHSFSLPSNAQLTPMSQFNATYSPFYNPLQKTSSLPPSWTRSLYDDDHLKLYRPAPPWSTLNEHLTQVRVEEAAAMERQEKHTRIIPPEEEIARVDMSSTKATLVKRQLDEWTLTQAQMPRDEKEKTMDVRLMDGEKSLLPRNPFRRQQQGVTKSLKPLKPISTVKVPILTPQVRKTALARESGLNLKRKRTATAEGDEADLTFKAGPRPKNVTTFNWKGWAS